MNKLVVNIRHHHNNRAGFSMPEAIIGVLLLSILGIGVLQVTSFSTNNARTLTQRVDTQIGAAFITMTLRSADACTKSLSNQPLSGGSISTIYEAQGEVIAQANAIYPILGPSLVNPSTIKIQAPSGNAADAITYDPWSEYGTAGDLVIGTTLHINFMRTGPAPTYYRKSIPIKIIPKLNSDGTPPTLIEKCVGIGDDYLEMICAALGGTLDRKPNPKDTRCRDLHIEQDPTAASTSLISDTRIYNGALTVGNPITIGPALEYSDAGDVKIQNDVYVNKDARLNDGNPSPLPTGGVYIGGTTAPTNRGDLVIDQSLGVGYDAPATQGDIHTSDFRMGEDLDIRKNLIINRDLRIGGKSLTTNDLTIDTILDAQFGFIYTVASPNPPVPPAWLTPPISSGVLVAQDFYIENYPSPGSLPAGANPSWFKHAANVQYVNDLFYYGLRGELDGDISSKFHPDNLMPIYYRLLSQVIMNTINTPANITAITNELVSGVGDFQDKMAEALNNAGKNCTANSPDPSKYYAIGQMTYTGGGVWSFTCVREARNCTEIATDSGSQQGKTFNCPKVCIGSTCISDYYATATNCTTVTATIESGGLTCGASNKAITSMTLDANKVPIAIMCCDVTLQ